MEQLEQLYAECVREWELLNAQLEEDLVDLSNCMGGEMLKECSHNTELLLMQMDEIRRGLKKILEN